ACFFLAHLWLDRAHAFPIYLPALLQHPCAETVCHIRAASDGCDTPFPHKGGLCDPAMPCLGMASSIVDLVILAGGRGSRLGGQDKAALVVGGRSLVERLLQDVDLGGVVVVVGHTPLPALPDGRTVLQ